MGPEDVMHTSEHMKKRLDGVRRTDLRLQLQLRVQVGGYHAENDTKKVRLLDAMWTYDSMKWFFKDIYLLATF